MALGSTSSMARALRWRAGVLSRARGRGDAVQVENAYVGRPRPRQPVDRSRSGRRHALASPRERRRGERRASTPKKKKKTGTRAPTPARSTSPRPKKSVMSRSAPARRTSPSSRSTRARTAPVWKSRPTKSEGRSATPSPRSCSRRVSLIDRCSRTSRSRTSVKSATPTLIRRGRRT